MPTRAIPVCAPGKLFLLGEYAVLAGGPALVTSVDRHVAVMPRNDQDGYQLEGADFDDALRLPILIKQVLRDEAKIDISPNQLTVDVSSFYHDGEKLGLGSSAASTVAIIASTAPQLSPRRRFELAWEVHRRLQGGVGSGADIAASTFGETLAFHLASLSDAFEQLSLQGLPDTHGGVETDVATIDADLSIPDELRIDAVWTGQSAHSVSFVEGLVDTLRRQPRATRSVLESIANRARQGIEALRQERATDFVDTIQKGDRAMERLGDLMGLPVITDTHRRIRALAHTTHSVAKPSGAGGGDFTLLVGPADAPVPPSISNDYLVISVA